MRKIDVPPVWLLATLVANWLLDRYTEGPEFGGLAVQAASLVVLAAAVSLLVSAALWFRRKKTASGLASNDAF